MQSYDVVLDNATRWNSTDAMMERALMEPCRKSIDAMLLDEIREWNDYERRRMKDGTLPRTTGQS